MPALDEATITVNGHPLTTGQSMAVRVAITSFLYQLNDAAYSLELGRISIAYRARLNEVMQLIIESGNE